MSDQGFTHCVDNALGVFAGFIFGLFNYFQLFPGFFQTIFYILAFGYALNCQLIEFTTYWTVLSHWTWLLDRNPVVVYTCLTAGASCAGVRFCRNQVTESQMDSCTERAT